MPFVSSQQFLLDKLAAAIASILDATGPVHASVKLAVAPFAPSPTSDPATFTEADFDGYAAKTVATWSTPVMNTNGSAETVSGSVLTWNPTGSTTSNLIVGYWVEGGNGDYLGGEILASPVPMNGPLSSLNLVPVVQEAPGSWSSVVIP
jgi:hypothetical protein